MQADQAVAILKPLVGEGTLVQTHASIVYITKEYVYKIKKPVNFGFLDYTHLKQRKAFSILEKELNSRFCEGIYLDVMKIINKDTGYDLVPITNSLPTVEYVLKMKRIPDELFLSNLLDSINAEQMEDIGSQIAHRLSIAEKSPEIVDEMDAYGQVSFNCNENFQQLNGAAKGLLDNRFYYAKKVTEDFLSANEGLFRARHTDGFVKDGHGDLRVEHVFLENRKVSLIDCIEFNNRFRINDVICEAAFLSMELDYNSRIDLSDAFLKGFFTVYNDADSLKLLNFYRCYRAVVRAKIAIFTMLGYKPDEPEYRDKLAEFHRMMDMAVIYARCCVNMAPLVFKGMIATGKSYSAVTFAERFPVKRINSDEERKRLAGMQPIESGVTEYDKGLYTAENSVKVYSMMGRALSDAAKTGRLCIVDATFMKSTYLQAFEAELEVRPLYFTFTVPENVIFARLNAREGTANVSDGRLHHYEKMKEEADVAQQDLLLSGEALPVENSSIILDFLIS